MSSKIEKLRATAESERVLGNISVADLFAAKAAELEANEPQSVIAAPSKDSQRSTRLNFGGNEILVAADKQDSNGLFFVEHPEKNVTDKRWQNNPSRWDAPRLNLHMARAVRHEEIRLGRAMTPTEQQKHIRKLLDEAAAHEREL